MRLSLTPSPILRPLLSRGFNVPGTTFRKSQPGRIQVRLSKSVFNSFPLKNGNAISLQKIHNTNVVSVFFSFFLRTCVACAYKLRLHEHNGLFYILDSTQLSCCSLEQPKKHRIRDGVRMSILRRDRTRRNLGTFLIQIRDVTFCLLEDVEKHVVSNGGR